MKNLSQRKEERTLMLSLIVIMVALVILSIIGFMLLSPPEEVIEGQADATSVRISGKVPGRVVDIYVAEGQRVKTGDTLAQIHSDVLDAKLQQVEALEAVAAAQNRKVDSGTRSQIIQGAYEVWQQAEAAESIARKTFERMQSLFGQGVVPEQKRDEAQAAYVAAVAASKAAQSQYMLAVEGAQREDKTSAAAMLVAAQGSVREVEAILEDQYLVAPCDGEIDEIYPNVGELVATGTPIMSLLKIQDMWVTFNVRETLLKDLPIGQEIEIMIPALGDKPFRAKVYYSRDMGDYAVWRATKATGQWDSRTFQIKARPLDEIDGLRPGMTVVYLQSR